ncbi:MAG: ArnT family glycosyltransferase, partial [Planctomycetia bacterium]
MQRRGAVVAVRRCLRRPPSDPIEGSRSTNVAEQVLKPNDAGRGAGLVLVAVLLLAALAARLAAAEYLLARGTSLPDSELYVAYAETIWTGRPFFLGGDGAKRTPGYPLFLTLCWLPAGGPSPRAVLWGQAIVGTATCLAVYLLGRRLENRNFPAGTAPFAAAALALEPYSIVLGGMQLSETVCTGALTAAAWSAVGWKEPVGVRRSLFAGLFAGASVLVRPSGLLLAGAVWGVALLCSLRVRIEDRPHWWKALAAAGLGFLVVMAPWWIRNAAVYGRWVPTTLNVGESLYDGLGPQALGDSEMTFAEDPAVRALPEVDRDDHWKRAAWSAAAADPWRVLRLAAVKAGRFWSPWPNAGQMRSPAVDLATT